MNKKLDNFEYQTLKKKILNSKVCFGFKNMKYYKKYSITYITIYYYKIDIRHIVMISLSLGYHLSNAGINECNVCSYFRIILRK